MTELDVRCDECCAESLNTLAHKQKENWRASKNAFTTPSEAYQYRGHVFEYGTYAYVNSQQCEFPCEKGNAHR